MVSYRFSRQWISHGENAKNIIDRAHLKMLSHNPTHIPFSNIFHKKSITGWWLTYTSEKYESQLG